jgi:hypothetical protein
MPLTGWKTWQPMRAEKKLCALSFANAIDGAASRTSSSSGVGGVATRPRKAAGGAQHAGVARFVEVPDVGGSVLPERVEKVGWVVGDARPVHCHVPGLVGVQEDACPELVAGHAAHADVDADGGEVIRDDAGGASGS